jgi:hypothetical protein
MVETTPTQTRDLDRYGNPPLEWSRARAALALMPNPEQTQFLGTCRSDGTPHAAGIGAQWLDGELYFTSSPAARKARDLAENPRCTISARQPDIDLVLEGSAARVTDRQTLERVAAGYRAAGWPAQVDGDAFTAPFNAPSAGPPPWHVYRFDFHTVYGVATQEPYGATRWRFPAR